MKRNSRFTERVDFTYIIGATISIFLAIVAIITYNDSGLPLMLPIVSLFSYAGVVIRGKADPDSWGKSPRKRRISALVGFTSIFVILFTEIGLLLVKNFTLPVYAIRNGILVAGVVMLFGYVILYNIWFKRNFPG